MKAALPADEKERIQSLYDLKILDTEREEAFDMITELASNICKTEVSFISLIDKERQWLKSAVGFDPKETPRDISFCAHAILQDDIFLIDDPAHHPLFKDNPLVTSDPNVQFYAGVPLKNIDGHKLGTLCVISTKKTELSDFQKRALVILGKQVEVLFSHRKSLIGLKELDTKKKRLMGHIVHDLKNPLAVLDLSFSLLKEKFDLDEKVKKIIDRCSSISSRMNVLTNNILDTANLEVKEDLDIDKQPFHVGDLLTDLISNMNTIKNTGQVIRTEFSHKEGLETEKNLFFRIVENLVSNSIKYSGKDSEIIVRSKNDQDNLIISVVDNGPGIPDRNKYKIFELHEKDSEQNTTNVTSHGIGLSFCRSAVEALGGEIWVEDNEPKGAIFNFSVPTK